MAALGQENGDRVGIVTEERWKRLGWGSREKIVGLKG